jgi:hypothetical protein
MALIDIYCATCAHYAEVVRRLSEWPATPPCPACGGPTEQRHLPPRVVSYVDPVVVYRAPDGGFRFPGEIGGTSCAKYEAMGYQRIEARGFAEVRALESRMNQREQSSLRRAEERRQQVQEQVDSERRAEIRRGLEQGFQIPERRLCEDGQIRSTGRMTTVRMRPQGRDAMRRAMDEADRKGHRRIGEPGVHVESYSMDKSNRESFIDARGHRYHR